MASTDVNMSASQMWVAAWPDSEFFIPRSDKEVTNRAWICTPSTRRALQGQILMDLAVNTEMPYKAACNTWYS